MPPQASRLQDELDDLRDEVTYLKVKLRKEGNVNRARLHRGARPAPGPAEPRARRRQRAPRSGAGCVGSGDRIAARRVDRPASDRRQLRDDHDDRHARSARGATQSEHPGRARKSTSGSSAS